MKTPEEMEADYQKGLKLQEMGYIRTNWRCDPENLSGNQMSREWEQRKERWKKLEIKEVI